MKPYKVIEINRIVVRGPDEYERTFNSLEEATEYAGWLNKAYEAGAMSQKIESRQ